MPLPTVALVGSPNVGKSTIFNRLLGRRKAIIDDVPGVTRDRIYGDGSWLGRAYSLIDTGGIEISDRPFQEEIRVQVGVAIEEADVIVLITDAKLGVTRNDRLIARLLYKAHKPIILACNKVDNRAMLARTGEFFALGLGDPLPVSGEHGIGIGDLLDKIISLLPPEKKEEEREAITFTVIGRPNVGKSTLVNALLGEERVIVSELAGTTRDAVDTRFRKDGKDYVVIDTAGLKKRGEVFAGVDKYAMLRALAALKRADIVLFLIDASHGIVELDKHVAGYASEEKKGIVVVVNKWDAVPEEEADKTAYEKRIRKEFKFLEYAPVVFISAKDKKNIQGVFKALEEVHRAYTSHVPTNVLNQIMRDAQSVYPAPEYNHGRLRIYFASQAKSAPPTFVLFVNKPRYAHFSYLRYLENRLRDAFRLSGTPVEIVLRERF